MPKSKTRPKVRAQKRRAAQQEHHARHEAFHYLASAHADLYLAQQLAVRGWHYEGPNRDTGSESWHEPGDCARRDLMRVHHVLLPDGYLDRDTPPYVVKFSDGEVEGLMDADEVLDAVDTELGDPECDCADHDDHDEPTP